MLNRDLFYMLKMLKTYALLVMLLATPLMSHAASNSTQQVTASTQVDSGVLQKNSTPSSSRSPTPSMKNYSASSTARRYSWLRRPMPRPPRSRQKSRRYRRSSTYSAPKPPMKLRKLPSKELR